MTRSKTSVPLIVALFFLFNCGGGYSPPSELEEPDYEKCFVETTVSPSHGATLSLDLPECGSLRYSKIILEAGTVGAETVFRLSASEEELIGAPSFKLNYPVKLEILSPADGEMLKDAVLSVPYVDQLLLDMDFNEIDLSAFFKASGEATPSLLSQSIVEKDGDKKIVSAEIAGTGLFEPGVHIYEMPEIGEPIKIDLSQSQGSFITEAAGGEGFVIMLTALPFGLFTEPITATSGSSSYTVTVSEPSAYPAGKIYGERFSEFKADPAVPSEKDKPDIDRFLDQKIRERLGNKTLLATDKTSRLTTASPLKLATVPAEGDRITGLYIWDYSGCADYFTDGCETLLSDQEAVVHEVTDHEIIMVHDHDGSYASLTVEELGKIDSLAASFEDIIYPRATFFFGEPSDVDGNQRIIILITDTLEDTGILGFYYPVDVFENDGLSPDYGGFGDSNEADIIYVTNPYSAIHELLLKGIVVHELQHLINFNNKTVKHLIGDTTGVPVDSDLFTNDTPMEELFLNEGLSHFSEDVGGYPDVLAGIPHILNHPNDGYLKNNYRTSLIDESDYGTYAVRGQGFLIVRYMFEQAGGATPVSDEAGYTDGGGASFLRNLISNSHTGIAAIEEVFPSFDPSSRGFTDTYLDWLVTLYNDGKDGALNDQTVYNYAAPYFDEINTNQKVGIDLTDTVTLEDTLETITFNGPKVYDFTDGSSVFSSTVSNVGASYVRYGLPGSIDGAKPVRFLISGVASSNLQGTIMRIRPDDF